MVWQDRILTLDHKSELFFTHQVYTDDHVLMSLLTVWILCKTTNPSEIQIFYFVPLYLLHLQIFLQSLPIKLYVQKIGECKLTWFGEIKNGILMKCVQAIIIIHKKLIMHDTAHRGQKLLFHVMWMKIYLLHLKIGPPFKLSQRGESMWLPNLPSRLACLLAYHCINGNCLICMGNKETSHSLASCSQVYLHDWV
jgi:hypothetical protein